MVHKIVWDWFPNLRQIYDNFAYPSSDVRDEIPASLREFCAQFATKFRDGPRLEFRDGPLLENFWILLVMRKVKIQATVCKLGAL